MLHPGIRRTSPLEGCSRPAITGVLVGTSLRGLVAFCIVIELASIPLILAVRSRIKNTG
jgi:hypothetical protein